MYEQKWLFFVYEYNSIEIYNIFSHFSIKMVFLLYFNVYPVKINSLPGNSVKGIRTA